MNIKTNQLSAYSNIPLSPPSDLPQQLAPVQKMTNKQTNSPPPSPTNLLDEMSTRSNTENMTVHLKNVKKILSLLQSNSSSWPFLFPVDPEKDNVPDYLDVIKNPMDFHTIQTKLNSYSRVFDFIQDVLLVFSNCFLYNSPSQKVYQLGIQVRNFFVEKVVEYFPEFENLKEFTVIPEKRETRSGKGKPGEKKRKSTRKRRLDVESSFEEEDYDFLEQSDEEATFEVDVLDEDEYTKPASQPTKTSKKSNRCCNYCGTRETPMWRRGPNGTGTLCNKCGVKWRNGRIMNDLKSGMLVEKKREKKADDVVKREVVKRERKFEEKKEAKKEKRERALSPVSYENESYFPTLTRPYSFQSAETDTKITRILTYKQKEVLSSEINSLPLEKLSRVIEIIKEETILNHEETEIELDLNNLSDETCFKLYEYVQELGGKQKSGKRCFVRKDGYVPSFRMVEGSSDSDSDF